MILSEEIPVKDGNNVNFKENDSLILSRGEMIDSSTPRKGQSASHVELSSFYNEESILSDTSLLRMRCLSQSISDMKTLREKQQERRYEMRDKLNDDFLHEHARKLKDARKRIQELEAKYQIHSRARSKSEVLSKSEDRKRKEIASGFKQRGNETISNAGEDENDGHLGTSDVQRTAEIQDAITQVNLEPNKTTRRSHKPRPLTWATEDDFSYSSDCNSLSSFGSHRLRLEQIPENLDRNRNEGSIPCYVTPRKYSGSNPTTIETTAKWQSMPNLSSDENTFLGNRALMYGEAIPVDPTRKTKKHKVNRKSGFYQVNDSPDKKSAHTTKKRKFLEKFRRKGPSKKNSQKSVGSPTDGVPLGRVIKCHPSIDTAYVIELNRPNRDALGFHLQKGYEQRKSGIFVCEILENKAEKFLSGLLHVGDEILEINNTNVREESLATVQKLIKNESRLKLSVLPDSTSTGH